MDSAVLHLGGHPMTGQVAEPLQVAPAALVDELLPGAVVPRGLPHGEITLKELVVIIFLLAVAAEERQGGMPIGIAVEHLPGLLMAVALHMVVREE